jgi:hypothetical protein
MDIKDVLTRHKEWLNGSPDGKRANLSETDLYGANLYRANLHWANLYGVDLREADLYGVNLRGANLRGANLRGANLRGANLREADLRGANLRGANLREADLREADLRWAKLPYYQICPEEGAFIAWKKVDNGEVIKLLIPSDARRTSSLVSRNCRAEKVHVISGNGRSMTSYYEPRDYVEDTDVVADSFDPDPRVDCSNGIHFFITQAEAQEFEM